MKYLTGIQKVLGVIFLSASSLVFAETLTIKLPAETTRLRVSNMPGYHLAVQNCLICHSADYIEYQPSDMQEKQWLAEVSKMQHAFGAVMSDNEAKAIAAYLAVAYGNKVNPLQ